MNRFQALAAATLCLASALAAAQSRGADGVTLINQSGALAGGVTANDAAGFPISITTSGTYRLTSNLVVPAGANGFDISPMLNVVIDLNGFQIVGPAVCSQTVDCMPTTRGTIGINSVGDQSAVKVANGRIRGFSRAAILIQGMSPAVIEDLHADNNYAGVMAENLVAERVFARGNFTNGMSMTRGHVRNSVATANRTGIVIDGRGRVTDSLMEGNGTGLYVAPYGAGVMAGNVLTANGVQINGPVTATSNLY